MKFKLEKLYLDCIDNEGNCFIIYWANLQFYFIKVIYSGLIFSDSDNKTIEKSSLRKIPKPIINDLLHCDDPILQINGDWKRIDPPVSLMLYKDPLDRELNWNCHHPKTITEIFFENKIYHGLGYAETLSLPVKPWRLPIDELRWGRFLSENFTIIWIHWKGHHPVNKLFCNGKLYDDAIFEEKSITFNENNFVLTFQESSIIRKGKLSNILLKMKWLKIIFHSRILNTNEVKYKAKSSLHQNLRPVSKGWSLYEIVTWKK
jgi:hypothetical protein